jgi:hypothetical protein
MKKSVIVLISLISFAILLAGCAKEYKWSANPEYKSASNDYFDARLTPLKSPSGTFLDGFELQFTNKTDKNLEIDWLKTRYLNQGNTRDIFVFENTTAENVVTPAPDTVAGGKSLTKKMWPLALVGQKSLTDPHQRPGASPFIGAPLPEGQNGIRLFAGQGGKIIKQDITIKIEVKEVKK